ncbi:MAG: hypothetical protein JW882_07535 [Deltaproteobacteria bacterium]|nr:hypothetical protein [Deltaproteobacteria bacterium]
MKKFSAKVTIPFFLFLFCFNAISAEKITGPKMLIEETLFDAKEVLEGDIIQHTFKILNIGDQPLEIKNIRPG